VSHILAYREESPFHPQPQAWPLKSSLEHWVTGPGHLPASTAGNQGRLLTEVVSKSDAFLSGRWWLTPVILATQEAEIRRTTVQSQPGKLFERL
jgi:hypothetical protein